MATENKGVMVYLPPELEKVIEEYCTQNNITRKNKDGEAFPSLGTGIVQYLKNQLLGLEFSSRNVAKTTLTREEVLDLIRENSNSPSLDNRLSESAILDMIQSQVASKTQSDLFVMDDIRVEIAQSLQPIYAEITELKKALSDLTVSRLTIKTPIAASIVSTVSRRSSSPKKQKPEDEPDWVSDSNRTFYHRLVKDSMLLDKVANVISKNSTSNADISQSLIKLGFHRQDGTKLGTTPISRIKTVVKHLLATTV
jgi:hypothetical protein